jgi:hypothetical protein
MLQFVLAYPMGDSRQTKRSCSFCQHDDRDDLEKRLVDGIVSHKEMDKEMSWRANTADRHFRNHMGTYHNAANPSCVVCTHDERREFEVQYFDEGKTTEEIAEEIDCAEDGVYRHMKYHFQPLVKRSATALVAVKVGHEIDLLRGNVESLNNKLATFMAETNVHDDGVVGDMVKLHREVRETLKDLVSYQDKWAEPEEKMVANTINILKVEMSKESPDTWKRVKKALLEQADGEEIDISVFGGDV